MDDEKIIRVNKLDDDTMRSATGYNPYYKEPKYPFLDRRTRRTKAINDSIQAWHDYMDFKDDMKTMAYAMGPGINFLRRGLVTTSSCLAKPVSLSSHPDTTALGHNCNIQ